MFSVPSQISVALRVAQLPRDRPVLDVPVAAVNLHRLRGEVEAAARAPQLCQRYQDAVQALRLLVPPGARLPHFEREGAARLHFNRHLDQRLSHQWEVGDEPPEGGSVMGVDRRFEAPAHDAEPHQRDAGPRALHHLHHAVDAAPIAPPPLRVRGP